MTKDIKKDKLKKIYGQKKSLRKTAEYFKCSYSKIRILLIKNKIEIQKKIYPYKTLTEKDIDEDIKTKLY